MKTLVTIKTKVKPKSKVDTKRKKVITKSAGSMPNPEPAFFFADAMSNSITAADIEKQPYALHWAIYSAVNVISRNIKRLERLIINKASNEVLENSPALDILRRPNQHMTLTTLIESIACGLLLPTGASGGGGGQVFLICDSGKADYHVDLTRGEIPASLYPYGDDAVSPVYSSSGKFEKWVLKIPGTKEKLYYEPHQIIRISNYNPYCIFKGLSPYAPAQLSIIEDIKTSIWNNRIFENDAIPSGVLTSDLPLQSGDVVEAERRWYQKHGAGNNRRIAVLGKGMKFQTIGLTQADMQYSKMKDRDRDIIFSTYGLNKIAYGNYEGINYATIIEGRKMLWEDTYQPLDLLINESITTQWIMFTDPGKKNVLKSDYTQVRPLQKDISKAVTSAKNLFTMGLPASLAMRKADIVLTDEELLEFPWLAEKPAPTPASFGAGEFDSMTEPKAIQHKGVSPFVHKLSQSEQDKISDNYVERVLSPGESSFYPKLVRFFNSLRNGMLDKVDLWGKTKKAITKADAPPNPDMFLFNKKEADKELGIVYKRLVSEQLIREATALEEELGALVSWKVTNPMIDKYAKARRKMLKKINTTTFNRSREQIADVIKLGLKNNWSQGEFSKAIKDTIGDAFEIRKNQSKMIARTETGVISSTARHDAFKAEGVEYNQWLNASDEKVRLHHSVSPAGDGGLVRKVGARFPNSGLRYPLDPTGDAGEVINCRCSVIAVATAEG